MKLVLACILVALWGHGSVQDSAISNRHFENTAKTMGHKLADSSYATQDFELEFEITYSEPGSVLDTVGINAAPIGSWYVTLTSDRRATFCVWDGRVWHQLITKTPLDPAKKTNLRFLRKGALIQSYVGGAVDATMALSLPLSGKPIFVGDFPGDEHWGSGYDIHRGFIGSVDIVWFGPVRATPTSIALVTDLTGEVPKEALNRLKARIVSIQKQDSIGLAIVFVKGLDSKGRIAEGGALYPSIYVASGEKPTVVIVLGDLGTSLYHTSSWLDKYGKDKVQAAINGLTKIAGWEERANTALDRLFKGEQPDPDKPVVIPNAPPRRISGEEVSVAAGESKSISMGSGVRISVPAQKQPIVLTTATLPAEGSVSADLTQFGPTVAIQWEGEVDPRTFVPQITYPASVIGNHKNTVIFRKGEQLFDDAVVPDQLTVLATTQNADGSVTAVDPYAVPYPEGVLFASIKAPEKPTFTNRYGIASYENALNWKNEPELVRMVPSDDANERKPYYKLSELELKNLRSFPLKNVIVLVHGHNEFEKGGYRLGDSAQPWVVAYKRDVWTLFWKTLKKSAKDYLDTTAVYEFIYPSYRPVFAPEMGVDGLGLSLAKAIADQTEIALAAEKDLDFNLFVIAHSMGGLVGRAGLNELGNARLRNTATRADMLEKWIGKMVTWGSPHHGSPLVTMRYLLTGAYDLEGSASVLPTSLLKQNGTYHLAINYFAAMDTPGERALRWDNHRPLNLRKAGWASPKREIMNAGNDETYAAKYGLDAGDWLYGTDLAAFNKRDRHRDKVTAFYGVTSKTLVEKSYFWRIFRNTTASRLALSSDIQKGTFLMEWLYQNPDTVLGNPVFKGDGAVPIESMISEGVLTRNFFLGDIDHEEYYGAPEKGRGFVKEGLGIGTSEATLKEIGLDGDKKSKTYPPSVELVMPFPTAPPVGANATLAVQARLLWNGAPKPGLRTTEAILVALDPNKLLDAGKTIPAKLTIKDTGEITGIVLVKDYPAKPMLPVVRVVFKDKTQLDSKVATPVDDILPALHKTTQLSIALSGVTQASTNPNAVGTGGIVVQTTWGFSGDVVSGIVKTANDYGKPCERPKLVWSGTEFSLSVNTGALTKTTKDRRGTTVSNVEQSLTLKGRYDVATRSIKGLSMKLESHSASDFTPDPNWRPRDRLEAEITGPPKASSSRTHDLREFIADQVALIGAPGENQVHAIYVGFRREGKVLQPSCYWTSEQEVEETGKPTVKNSTKFVLGPPTKPSPFEGPGLTLTFFTQK